ncbi:MAG: cytochrome c oxidase assembly protein [Gemmatimonadota bacterium]
MIPSLPPFLGQTARPTGPFQADWDLHPSTLIGVTLLTALYWWGVGPARRRYNLGPPVEPWRVVCFASAMIVLLVAVNGPIHHLSDYYLFSVHMVQHLVLTLGFPPLLIAGVPGWLVTPLLRHKPVRVLAQVLGHPVVAAVVFSATVAFWHVVPFYELMMRNHDVHIVTHVLFMVTAVMMWWPVMHDVPGLKRLSPSVGMFYLFLVGIPMQLVAAIITFSDSVLYTWYEAAPRTWGLAAIDDQRLGGLIMWVPGNLWIWGAISVLFFRWARAEGDRR